MMRRKSEKAELRGAGAQSRVREAAWEMAPYSLFDSYFLACLEPLEHPRVEPNTKTRARHGAGIGLTTSGFIRPYQGGYRSFMGSHEPPEVGRVGDKGRLTEASAEVNTSATFCLR